MGNHARGGAPPRGAKEEAQTQTLSTTPPQEAEKDQKDQKDQEQQQEQQQQQLQHQQLEAALTETELIGSAWAIRIIRI